MKVLLVDADVVRANLPLMKVSSFHRSKGDQTFLKKSIDFTFPFECLNPDKIYLSCIFDWNREKALSFVKVVVSRFNVDFGGSGIDLSKELPFEIEHIQPDYNLYGIDYGIGFTSRGCIRNCPWCIVPQKEGKIRDHARIDEFLHPSKKLILYDNNFLASPKWYENLRYIIARKIKVSFNQGLDIRLIDQENAKWLSKARALDDQFKTRRIYYSFDVPQIEDQVLQGIRTLKKVGFKCGKQHSQQMCYVLIGYNTSYEEDLHRVNLLIKEGVFPYIMPYNNRKDSYYPHLERWVNGRFYQVVPWKKYSSGNSQEIIRGLG